MRRIRSCKGRFEGTRRSEGTRFPFIPTTLAVSFLLFAIHQVPQLPIGISKKCCFCCMLLCELLHEWRERQSDSVKELYPKFELPGTHASIFPWMAPAKWLPEGILEAMRARLWEIVLHIARSGSGVKSTQTSPALSLRSLPVDVPNLGELVFTDDSDF